MVRTQQPGTVDQRGPVPFAARLAAVEVFLPRPLLAPLRDLVAFSATRLERLPLATSLAHSPPALIHQQPASPTRWIDSVFGFAMGNADACSRDLDDQHGALGLPSSATVAVSSCTPLTCNTLASASSNTRTSSRPTNPQPRYPVAPAASLRYDRQLAARVDRFAAKRVTLRSACCSQPPPPWQQPRDVTNSQRRRLLRDHPAQPLPRPPIFRFLPISRLRLPFPVFPLSHNVPIAIPARLGFAAICTSRDTACTDPDTVCTRLAALCPS